MLSRGWDERLLYRVPVTDTIMRANLRTRGGGPSMSTAEAVSMDEVIVIIEPNPVHIRPTRTSASPMVYSVNNTISHAP